VGFLSLLFSSFNAIHSLVLPNIEPLESLLIARPFYNADGLFLAANMWSCDLKVKTNV